MKGLSIAAVVATLIVTAAAAAPAPTHLMPQPIYFPLEIGTWWVYTNKDYDSTLLIEDVTEVDRAKRVALIERGKTFQHRHTSEVSDTGVAMVRSDGDGQERYLWMIHRSKLKNKSWAIEFEDVTLAIHANSSIQGEEWVEVPAGKFFALKIVTNGERDKESIRETTWWAPRFGRVKQDRNGHIEELKRFGRGDGSKRKTSDLWPRGVGLRVDENNP